MINNLQKKEELPSTQVAIEAAETTEATATGEAAITSEEVRATIEVAITTTTEAMESSEGTTAEEATTTTGGEVATSRTSRVHRMALVLHLAATPLTQMPSPCREAMPVAGIATVAPEEAVGCMASTYQRVYQPARKVLPQTPLSSTLRAISEVTTEGTTGAVATEAPHTAEAGAATITNSNPRLTVRAILSTGTRTMEVLNRELPTQRENL